MLNVGDAYIALNVDRRAMSQSFAEGRRDVTQWGNHVEREVQKTGRSFGKMGEMLKGVFQGIGIAAADKAMGLFGSAVGGAKNAILGLNGEAEQASAKINAFTKSNEKTAEILEMVRMRAAKTPFAFSEMANAAGSLIPVGKQANLSLEELMKTAEILAASNPMEGLEGASFSLREAMTGDFTSIIERFNLSRQSINKWKEEGLSNFEIVQRAMAEMGYDADLVAAMGDTMSGRWSTLNDTLDQFKIKATAPIFNVLKNGLVTVQGYLDQNSEAVSKYAELLGTKLARGLSIAGNWLKELVDRFMGVNSLAAKGGTPIEQLTARIRSVGVAAREAFGIARDVASGFIGVIRDTIGAVREVYSVLVKGDFTGAGPWEEDEPIPLAMFKFRELIQSVIDKYEDLRQKVSIPLPAVKVPDLPGGGDQSTAQMAGAALGIGAMGAGALALAPALSPVVSIVSNLGGVFGMLLGAINPVTLSIGALALAAGGLYLAWSTNFLGIRDTVDQTLPAVKETIDGFKESASAAFDSLKTATEPLRADFLTFWKNDLQPAIQGVADQIGPAIDRIRDSILNLAHSEGLATFKAGVKDAFDAAGPIILSVAGYMREDLGPAIVAVINYVGKFVEEWSKAVANIISLLEPFFEFVGKGLSTLANFINEHSEQIKATLKGAWDFIAGVVQAAWSLVSGIVLAGLKVLQGDWSGAWETIKSALTEAWEGIKRAVEGATVFIGGIITLWLEAVKGIWSRAWEWIRDRLGELSTEISNKLTEWSNGLVSWLDTKAASIQSAVLKPFEMARDAIGGIMSSFVDKMKAPLNTGIGALNKFGGGLAGVLNWIAGKLKIDVNFGWQDIPALAKGTGPNWSGGWAWVGEGPGGAGAEMAYLAPGSHVIPHRESMAMAERMGIPTPKAGASLPGFVLGLENIPGLSTVIDFITNTPQKIVEMAMGAVGLSAPEIPGVGGAGAAMFGMVKDWVITTVKGWIAKVLPQGGEFIGKALAAAESQLGLPYIWGGEAPGTGFDCSGFVRYVTQAAGLAAGMPRVVKDIYGWSAKGRNPLLTFGFQNPENDDPRIQHIGIGIAIPGGGMQWFEAGGRAGGVGRTSDYWQSYGAPPALGTALLGSASGPNGSAPPNPINDNLRLTSVRVKMANGGIVDEPIYGIGADSGISYLLGELGKEIVIPESVLPAIIGFFAEAMMTGNYNSSHLLGIPLELRDVIIRVARNYMPEARSRRANGANGKGSGGSSGPGGVLGTGPDIPKTSPPSVPPLNTNTTGLNNGGKKFTADEQIYYAETYGAFYPGELMEDDPRIVKAIAKFRAKAAGLPDTTGLNNNPVPDAPKTDNGAPPSGAVGSGGGGQKTIVIRVESREAILQGIQIARSMTSDPIAIEELADGVTEVQAREDEAIVWESLPNPGFGPWKNGL